MDNAEPRRANDLIDIALPSNKKSTSETVEPRRDSP
jgi:hypothetical protein